MFSYCLWLCYAGTPDTRGKLIALYGSLWHFKKKNHRSFARFGELQMGNMEFYSQATWETACKCLLIFFLMLKKWSCSWLSVDFKWLLLCKCLLAFFFPFCLGCELGAFNKNTQAKQVSHCHAGNCLKIQLLSTGSSSCFGFSLWIRVFYNQNIKTIIS